MKFHKKLLPVVICGTVTLAGCESSLRYDALNKCYAQSGLLAAVSAQEKSAIVESCGKSVAAAFEKQ